MLLPENTILFQLTYSIENLLLDSALLRKVPEMSWRHSIMAKEMLGEAEMTCSFEKWWYTGLGEMMDGELPLHAVELSMWSLPLLRASEESVAGTKDAVLLPRTLCCLSLPCPLSLPANRGCLLCKAVLCNLAWEMRMVMLHFFAAIKGCLKTVR